MRHKLNFYLRFPSRVILSSRKMYYFKNILLSQYFT